MSDTTISRFALFGAAAGLAWGIVARIWMRVISTEPEFTWSGTLTILVFAAWLGMGVGIFYACRVTGRRPWLALLGIPGLATFLSPGIVFLPAFILGSAIWNRAIQPRVRQIGVALGALAVSVPTWIVWDDARFEQGAPVPMTVAEDLAYAGGFGLLSLALAYGGSFLWRSGPTQLRRGEESGEVGLLGTDGGVVAVTGVYDGLVGQRKQHRPD